MHHEVVHGLSARLQEMKVVRGKIPRVPLGMTIRVISNENLRGVRVLRGEIVLIIALTGCMVGPDYKSPAAEIPPQFRAA